MPPHWKRVVRVVPSKKALLMAGALASALALLLARTCWTSTASGGPIQPTERSGRAPDSASGPGQPQSGSPERSDASPTQTTRPELSKPELSKWVDGLELIEGKLSPEETRTASSYVEPMLRQAVAELRTTAVDAQDADALAREASTVKRIELWKAVSNALLAGDYQILATPPTTWRNPPNTMLQTLPSWKHGKPVTLLFWLDTSKYVTLGDAAAYDHEMHRFQLAEAARRFNELPNAEREQLHERYLSLLSQRGSWMALPADLRKTFPIENSVDRPSLLMRSPP